MHLHATVMTPQSSNQGGRMFTYPPNPPTRDCSCASVVHSLVALAHEPAVPAKADTKHVCLSCVPNVLIYTGKELYSSCTHL